jgi:hypothetical protein
LGTNDSKFFQAGKVVFANHAESGETIKSFTSEKRFEKVMSQIKKEIISLLSLHIMTKNQALGSNHKRPTKNIWSVSSKKP